MSPMYIIDLYLVLKRFVVKLEEDSYILCSTLFTKRMLFVLVFLERLILRIFTSAGREKQILCKSEN